MRFYIKARLKFASTTSKKIIYTDIISIAGIIRKILYYIKLYYILCSKYKTNEIV